MMGKTINYFFKKEYFLLGIVFITFINPFFYGYRIAILFILYIFFKIKYFYPIVDRSLFYLFFFSLSYEFIQLSNVNVVEKNIISILLNIFIPSVLYLIGKYISTYYPSTQIILFFLFFIAFFFSIVPMISILMQISNNGFIVGTRSMYLIWDKNILINATGLGSFFLLNMVAIGIINIKKELIVEKWINRGVVALFIFSFICVLRLGSRTQLVVASLSLLLSYLLNLRKQSLLKNIFLLIIFTGIIYFIVNNINEESTIMKFYADRMDNNEFGLETAGGRTERWVHSIEAILTNPWGWEFSRYGYAHNLWLDVARVSGIIPFLILILFTISSIKSFILSLKALRNNLFIRIYILVYFLGFYALFFVEPVMEGVYLLFLLFCVFTGLISGLRYKNIKP